MPKSIASPIRLAVIGVTFLVSTFAPSLVFSTPIDYGDCIQGSIYPFGEIDTYTFDGAAGDVIIIRMTKSSGFLLPFLELFDPGGNKLTEDSGYPQAEIDTLTLPGTGTYIILASDCDGDNTGDYGLSLQRTFNPGGAVPITYGTTLQDSIVLIAELDAYTFDGTAGDVVIIRMTRSSGFLDPFLELFDPAGTRIAEDQGYPQAEIGPLSLESTGSYTILASDYDGDDTGNYSLTLIGTPPGIHDRDPSIEGPALFALYQSYPNPSHSSTSIRYSIPSAVYVRLSIYNQSGGLVRTLVSGMTPEGMHTITWDRMNNMGAKVSSGFYFYRLEVGEFTATKKMVVLR